MRKRHKYTYLIKYKCLGTGSKSEANINIAWALSEQPLSDAEYLAELCSFSNKGKQVIISIVIVYSPQIFNVF